MIESDLKLRSIRTIATDKRCLIIYKTRMCINSSSIGKMTALRQYLFYFLQ